MNMKSKKTKDALTDLIEEAKNEEEKLETARELRNDEAVSSSGEIVTLNVEISRLAKKIVKLQKSKKQNKKK